MEVFLISFTAACRVSRHNLCALAYCSEKWMWCSPLGFFAFHNLLSNNTAPMPQRRHSRHDGKTLGALRRVWLNVVKMHHAICHLHRTVVGEYCARTILLSCAREHYLATWRIHGKNTR
ncbi:hypothetical protein TvY486_0045830 [Trypanosoma vivax Y486]|uniref:Uncharacterized protein n=1 Tax=Trypanosoma vivax (strain Y486) TaxID=1055687 RepID=F9WVQ4_TRYVY|nr:hypothetical protein TvY486_0045830 [Trypanosoma vivax Y486]|eukprot:CCD21662.1 hypothetical protein TvY486_0045830 [Trypanosoma vivax Y486]